MGFLLWVWEILPGFIICVCVMQGECWESIVLVLRRGSSASHAESDRPAVPSRFSPPSTVAYPLQEMFSVVYFFILTLFSLTPHLIWSMLTVCHCQQEWLQRWGLCFFFSFSEYKEHANKKDTETSNLRKDDLTGSASSLSETRNDNSASRYELWKC